MRARRGRARAVVNEVPPNVGCEILQWVRPEFPRLVRRRVGIVAEPQVLLVCRRDRQALVALVIVVNCGSDGRSRSRDCRGRAERERSQPSMVGPL